MEVSPKNSVDRVNGKQFLERFEQVLIIHSRVIILHSYVCIPMSPSLDGYLPIFVIEAYRTNFVWGGGGGGGAGTLFLSYAKRFLY